MTEDTRLATLTTDALRAAGNKTVDEIRAMLVKADQMQEQLHADAEAFIADIGSRSLGITDSVSAYVAFCEQTTKMFTAAADAAHKLNGNGAAPRVLPADRAMPPVRKLDTELGKLQSSQPSPLDGRR